MNDSKSAAKPKTPANNSIGNLLWFQPYRSGSHIDVYRSMANSKRQCKEMDRLLAGGQPRKSSWLGQEWEELVCELEAIWMALLFHILQLVLVVICNVAFFWALLAMIEWWVE